MQVYVFQSDQDPDLFGITSDPPTSRLPREHGPWALHRITRLEDLTAIDTAQAEADIKASGFHLCRGLETATPP